MNVYLLHDGYDGPISAHLTNEGAVEEKKRLIRDKTPVDAKSWYDMFHHQDKYESLEACVRHWQETMEEVLHIEEMPVS